MWWLAHGEVDVPDALDWLTPHERTHLDSIRFTKRRNEYLTRRWTTKQAVASALDLDRSPTSLERVEVRHHDSGAPFVHLDGASAGVHVSMSDRSGWAVCLVGEADGAAALGIDLEVVEPRSQRFVDDFFTARERDHVRSCADDEQTAEAANLIWSAKEAALKVLQVGLRADTRTVEVQLEAHARADGWRPLAVVGPDGPMPGWWRRDGVFLLTVVSAASGEPPQLLPHGNDLAAALPHHSWVDRPRC
jgi:4'-phosphopantetheinyl transferase